MVSVIIPVYNTEPYLRKCVESVCGQTLADLEIILVDDGSTDGSGAICDEYARRDGRVLAVHQENGGSTSARNAGLRAAHGEYVGFVDSDDWIDAPMYAEMLALGERTQADVVICGKYISREGAEHPERLCVPEGVYQAGSASMDRLLQNLIYSEDCRARGISPNLWDKLFKRELLCAYQFQVDRRIRYGEDDVCVYPCLLHAGKIAVTGRAYYHYRMREGSVCHSTDERYFEGITLFYQQLKREFSAHPASDVLMRQLNRYMLEFALRGINKFFGFGYGMVVPFFLPPWRLLRESRLEVIALYGAGEVGQSYYRWFQMTQTVRVAAWADRLWEDCRRRGLPVGPASDIRELACDGILIAADHAGLAESIRRSLEELGIPAEKIFYERPQNLIQTVQEAL